MGWSAPRQYTFCFGTARFGSRHHDDLWLDDIGQTDVRDVRLGALLRQPGARMSWLYGDDPAWVHEILLEAVEDAAPLACMAGAGACPPVDCGGPAGYAEVLRQWSARRLDPLVASWLPRGFDPDHFDPAEVQLEPFIALQGRAALDAGLGGVLPWWGGSASQEVAPVRAAPRAPERQVVEQILDLLDLHLHARMQPGLPHQLCVLGAEVDRIDHPSAFIEQAAPDLRRELSTMETLTIR